jgi:hypothetical protein
VLEQLGEHRAGCPKEGTLPSPVRRRIAENPQSALVVALSLPLWLAVEEVLQAARVETRLTARKPERVGTQRVVA